MDFEQLAKIENESERVNRTYDIFNEDARLNHSKAARVEFLTTVHYIEKYLKDGIAEYIKRLGRFTKFESIELTDEKTPDNASEAENKAILDKAIWRYGEV